jgi:transcriptional regulator with XRE-family HTH domain
MAKKPKKPAILTDKQKIAERLREGREDAGLTQVELAKKAGLGRSTIMHYENAKAVPGGMELIKLASTLELTPNFILMGKERFAGASDPELALSTAELLPLMMRVILCLMTLDSEVRESFSGFLMSLVKQKLSKKDYKNFNKMADIMASGMVKMVPDLEAQIETLGKGGHFDQLIKALEAIPSEQEA